MITVVGQRIYYKCEMWITECMCIQGEKLWNCQMMKLSLTKEIWEVRFEA